MGTEVFVARNGVAKQQQLIFSRLSLPQRLTIVHGFGKKRM